MKRTLILFFTAAAALLLTAGCCSDTLTIPAANTKVDKKLLDADNSGHYFFKTDEDCEVIRYRNFHILREGLEQLHIYLHQNRPDYAQWRVDPKGWQGQNLICGVTQTVLPPQIVTGDTSQMELLKICRARFGKDARNLTVTPVKISDDSIDAVEYFVSLTTSGSTVNSHGYLFFVPDRPGVVGSIFYSQRGSGTTAPQLRDLGERFIRAVRFDEP